MYKDKARIMSSFIWHKKDGTRTVVAHVSADEMEAARQRHELYGIFNLQEGIKNEHKAKYGNYPHKAADVVRGVKYWKDRTYQGGEIYELCDGKNYTTLVEAYYWHIEGAPEYPYQDLP